MCNLDVVPQAGTQPIHFAAGNGHTQVVELLLNKYKVTPGVLNNVSRWSIETCFHIGFTIERILTY